MVKEGEEEERHVIMGRYEMGRLLGKGTFGKVYHGRDISSDKSVAIKTINIDQVKKVKGMMDQIQREISIMRIVQHPNIVELKEVMATKTRIFFVMEYVRGGELFAKVEHGRLSEDEARHYFRQLISAVDFCHSRGVTHRDLKPENLLLDEFGHLKVSDFGLSALPEQHRQDGLLHTQCGTPAYVAPEVLRNKGYDGTQTDVWSCGVILFVLLTGHLPFQHENMMKMYQKIFKGEYQMPPWVSGDAKKLIAKMLAVDPKKRIPLGDIMRDPWFKKGRVRSIANVGALQVSSKDDKDKEQDDNEQSNNKTEILLSPRSYNAFQLISSMSSGFDLSSLFEIQQPKSTIFTSKAPAETIITTLEKVGNTLGFTSKRGKKEGYGVRLECKEEGRKGKLVVNAEVFEAAPEVAVVEFGKCSGDTLEYNKFCAEDVRPGLKDVVWAWQGESEERFKA